MSNTILFTTLDDQVILRAVNGLYKQAKLAMRGNHVYAQVSGGFVMLYANGTTSHPNVRWLEMENQQDYATGSLGRLIPIPSTKVIGASDGEA